MLTTEQKKQSEKNNETPAPDTDPGGKAKKPKKDPEKQTEKKPKPKFWSVLFPYLKPYTKNMVVSIVFSMLTGVAVAIQPLVIKYIVDSGVGDEPFMLFGKELFSFAGAADDVRIRFIIGACIFYIVLSLLRVVSWAIGYMQILKTLEGTLFSLRSKFFGHVQHMCMRFHDKNSSGELFNYIMGSPMGNVKSYLHSMIQSVPYQAVSLAISLVALLSYSWKLTLLTLFTSILMTLLYRHSRTKVRKATQVFLRSESEASRYIADILHGTEAIKMYSIEEATIQRFDSYVDNLKSTGIQYNWSSFREHAKPELVQYVGTAAVYCLGGILCIKGEITVGILYAFLSCMGTILGTLSSWLSIALTKNSAAVALDRVQQIIEEASTTPEVADNARRSIDIERASAERAGKPCIELSHVNFAYGDKRVFNDFNCKIGYRESIGLVGGSGSGKSTFTKLIMRLYEVEEGKIFIHGKDIKSYETHELRMSYGVVPQNPYIFCGTIWDNIRIVRPEATNKEIIDAMEIARVHEFVNDLPMGWATVIGDGALGLSGGQKQRIAIARAVLKRPDIFIFDEATSALDNISERLIQAAMEDLMKEHSVIIVAHRLSTIRNVDRIIVFDHGNIIQEGSYDELAATEGEFKRLLDAAELSDAAKNSGESLLRQ